MPGTAASALIRSRRAALRGGRKPSKKKRSVGRPATQSAASAAEAPGAAVTARPGGDRLGDQLEAGVGDERRAGVGDQRQRLALRDALQRARARLGGVVLVIGRERRLDPVAGEQRARDAGVLGEDRVGAGEDRERPQRHVAEIADRRRDDVEARGRAAARATATP